MSVYSAVIGWMPRFLVYTLAGLIQIGLIAAMVYDRARILRQGMEVTLKTRPIDPRDFLRGDYVVLTYEISTVRAGELAKTPAPGRRTTVYVKLAPNPDGVYDAVSVHRERVPVTGREVLVQGRVIGGTTCGADRRDFCDRLHVKYGIERYFVPEGEGRALEDARNKGRVSIVVAVTPSGRGAIKRLLLDGKPVYDEPMF